MREEPGMNLDRGLRALAASMAEEAPPRLELELRRAFRQRVRRQRMTWALAIGSMAAGMVVAAILLRPLVGPEVGPPELRVARIEVPNLPMPVRAAQETATGYRRSSVPRLALSRRPIRQAPQEPAAVFTRFYTLPGADGPFESGALVRVELPRSAVQFVGLPVNESRRFERIQADVLLGQDGIARAVRFVQ